MLHVEMAEWSDQDFVVRDELCVEREMKENRSRDDLGSGQSAMSECLLDAGMLPSGVMSVPTNSRRRKKNWHSLSLMETR